MRDSNAQQLLAKVMGWKDSDAVNAHVPMLQLLADHKYDQYQRFAPGRRFIESLALWLNRFAEADRAAALEFVTKQLVFFSEREMGHLVEIAYPDLIAQERIRLVAEECDIPPFCVGKIVNHPRFKQLRLKSLYLGLSDGARTSELRRAAGGEINNEQIWQAYELGPYKAEDMVEKLGKFLHKAGFKERSPKFNLIWLLDDFSGSGNTYIRFKDGKFSGKIRRIYDLLHQEGLVDTSHYEIFLLLYVATRQAIDHIEYWAERFTTENGYKPLQVKVLCVIEKEMAITGSLSEAQKSLLANDTYVDNTERIVDEHFRVGGTDDARWGFAGCALPVVLSHNTPNNSLFILWGPEDSAFCGLFPRLSRHREF